MQMLLYCQSRVLDRSWIIRPALSFEFHFAPAIMLAKETVYDNIFLVNLLKLVAHMLN